MKNFQINKQMYSTANKNKSVCYLKYKGSVVILSISMHKFLQFKRNTNNSFQ